MVHEINFALQLDFNKRPRLSRNGKIEIMLKPSLRQPNGVHRSMVLHLCNRWGLNEHKTRAQQEIIAQAATKQIVYDYGFLDQMKGGG